MKPPNNKGLRGPAQYRILRVMSGPDPEDPWASPVPHDLGPFDRRVTLARAPDGMTVAPEVDGALDTAAAALRAAGWTVEDGEPPSMRDAAARADLVEPASHPIVDWGARAGPGCRGP